ncbi:AfsR/SARP family transcriptional regulator [Streptomyces carpaticus]|uniref:AfsR/SARP family transcriptional regulator n=1 Tax=Streptomyces carpaticus TaxID=285558 RepID=UPI0031F76393
MDIRLLGPLEVRTDGGREIGVSAPMLRATLAALALHPGQVVPVDELAEQLWGAHVPSSARTTLRNYLMRLRKLLPGEPLRTVPGGYQLQIREEETDQGRLRAALGRSRELAGHERAGAAALLDGAVRLWRGTPLSDLPDCPLRTVERPRLTELYLTAVEERFELKLGLGEHGPVVDEIATMARAHPLRERLVRQLMLALYRTGRTAEALSVYREARQRLVEELGIEPGGELRELETLILRGNVPAARPESVAEPVRAADAAVAAPAPAPLPVRGRAAFPPAIATFVARAVELGRIRARLSDAVAAPAVCLIDGPGGVGKSALAVRAAREVADRFPDGLLYVDLRGADPRNAPLSPAEARQRLLASLGAAVKEVPADPVAAAAYYQEWFTGRRMLVLLDNALDSAQISELLPAEPGCAALVTSRSALTGVHGGHHLHLSTLSTADAIAFVQSIAEGSAERGTPAQWEKLVELCGHLPLALRIIATRMAARPRWSVADWTAVLRDERLRMDELSVDDLDLRTSLTVSIEQLGDVPAARVFPLLGTAAVLSYSPEAVAELAGCPVPRAREALERLADAQIATSPRPGVYVLHDLVRSAAVWQADRLPPQRSREALAGLARWCVGSLHRSNAPLALARHFATRYAQGAARFAKGRSFRSVDESLPWTDEVLEDVLALAAQLAEPEFDSGEELAGRPLSCFALESVRALETYLGLRLSWRAQRRLCELALAVGERQGDVFAQAVAYGQLGKAAGQQGEAPRGMELLERATRLFRALGDREEALGTMMNMVPTLGSSGRLAEAVDVGHRALAEAEELGNTDSRAQIINNLGRCHLYLGEHDQAYRLFTSNYEAVTVPYERTIAAGLLAEYHLETREFEEAARWANRALRHSAEQPFDPFVAAQQRTWLAAALRGLGREEAARAEESRAKAVLDDLNSRENLHLRVRVEERYAIG